MKKFGIYLTMIFVFVILSSCTELQKSPQDAQIEDDVVISAEIENSNEDQSDTSMQDKKDEFAEVEAVYVEIIERYRLALKENWDAQKCMDKGVNYLVGLYEGENRSEAYGYKLIDLDGNGVYELIIGSSDQNEDEFQKLLILDLYTVSDGQPIQVFGSLERNCFYYLGDDLFSNIGSSAWDDSVDNTVKYEANAVTEVDGSATAENRVQIEFLSFLSN